MGSVECADATHQSLIEHVNRSKKISNALREVTLCAGIRTANMTIWNKTFDLYRETNDEAERTAIFSALACSLDRNIIKSYLAKLILPGYNSINAISVIEAVAEGSEAGIDIILDFVTENVETLHTIYGNWNWLFGILYMNAKIINTDALIEKVTTFLNPICVDGKRGWKRYQQKQILAETEKNVRWLKEYEPQILLFLLS